MWSVRHALDALLAYLGQRIVERAPEMFDGATALANVELAIEDALELERARQLERAA